MVVVDLVDDKQERFVFKSCNQFSETNF